MFHKLSWVLFTVDALKNEICAYCGVYKCVAVLQDRIARSGASLTGVALDFIIYIYRYRLARIATLEILHRRLKGRFKDVKSDFCKNLHR